MSKSRKILLVFGILELIGGVINLVPAVQNGEATSWITAIAAFLCGCLLLMAAVNPRMINGAWIITLVNLVLSILGAVLVFTGDKGTVELVSNIIAVVLNLIVFIAANNVKSQVKNKQIADLKEQLQDAQKQE